MEKRWKNYTRSKFVAIILVLVLMVVSVSGTTVFGESDDTQLTVENQVVTQSAVIDQAKLLEKINVVKDSESFGDMDELAGFKDQSEKDTFITYIKEKKDYTLFYVSEFDQLFESDGSMNIFVGCKSGETGEILNEEVIFVIHNNTTETKEFNIQIGDLEKMTFSVDADKLVYSIDSKEGILQKELEELRIENTSIEKATPSATPSATPTTEPGEMDTTDEGTIQNQEVPTPEPEYTVTPESSVAVMCIRPTPPKCTPKPTLKPTAVPTATPTIAPTPTAIPKPLNLEPEISKTAVRNGDDLEKYQVNLSVSGDEEVEMKTHPADVVVVLDVSNSMYWSMQDSTLESIYTQPTRYNDERSRWYALQVALKGMVDAVLDVQGSRVTIVIYTGNMNDREYKVLKQSVNSSDTGWYSDKSVVNQLYYSKDNNSKVPTIKLADLRNDVGGTNGKAGFTGAKEQLGKATSSQNPKYVVYMSDGVPNRYFDKYGDINETYNIQVAGAAAIAEAKSIVSQYGASICTVGLGAGLTSHPEVQGYLMNPVGEDKYQVSYTQADTNSDLTKLFGDLAETFTHMLTNVSVEDQISQFVDPVLVNGCPEFTLKQNDLGVSLIPNKVSANIIRYKDASNREVVTYTVDSKTIKWNVGDTVGSSDKYTLSYPVVVNEKALYYKDGYQGKTDCLQADLLTGTHSGEYGYHSNDHATIFYNGGLKKMFPHPVVQPIPDATLRITKKLSTDSKVPDNMKFNFLVKINGTNYSGDVYIDDSSKPIKVDNGQLWLRAGEVATINRLSKEDTYSVKEIGIIENDYFESKLVKTEKIITPIDKRIAISSTTLPTKTKVVKPIITGKMSSNIEECVADVDLIFTNKISYLKGSITVNKNLVDKLGNLKSDELDTNSFIFELCYADGFDELVGTTCFGSITINKGDTGNEKISDGDGNVVPKYSFTFDNLPVGNYKIREVNHMRYDLVSIDSNGSVTLSKSNLDQTINVKNRKGRTNYFSDSAIAVNIGKLINKKIAFIKKESDE